MDCTRWIEKLSDGDERAAEILFRQYFDQLILLAVHKMRGMKTTVRSAEDIALSVVKSLCLGLREQKMPWLTEDDLWGCLFQITTRKICAERRRAMSQKRGGHVYIYEGDAPFTSEQEEESLFHSIVGREPSPELALQMAENADELLALFDDYPIQKNIISLKLQGFSNAEIAAQTELVERTIFWHLKNIQHKWFFFQSMFFLVENALEGMEPSSLASFLECSEDLVRQLLQQLLRFWLEETKDVTENRLLEKMLFQPQEFQELLNVREETASRLDCHRKKLASLWIQKIRKTWKKELLKIWQTEMHPQKRKTA